MNYRNPIISGYHPDPSICRAGDTFYLVNSSFEFFPGVPVYRSKNLINWEAVGHVLDRRSQLELDKCRESGGIYAPTIRYHEGIFYMTTTNVSNGGNFIVHTEDPAEGWSEPAWVAQGGIDPSILFDDDGKVYYTTAGNDENGRQALLICEVDPLTGEKKTETKVLSYGCGGRYPEGPHLYKINGKYYLMLAEGGTEYGHMETMQRSDSPYGPFEACPYNPILSHKEDTRERIYCTGHADIVEDTNGNWWMVCLAIRPCGGEKNRILMHNLGRETYLTPITWTEDGWPIAGEGGLIDIEMDGPLPGIPAPVCRDFADDFSEEVFPVNYNFLRNPVMENYVRSTQEKRLLLKGSSVTLNDMDTPTWAGVRQEGFETVTTAAVYPKKQRSGIRAGLTAYYNMDYHYDLYVTKDANRWSVCLAKHVHDMYAVTAQAEVSLNADGGVFLKIETDKEYYSFYYSADGVTYQKLGSGHVAGLCTEQTRTMTFTGTYLAMFAENGEAEFADFRVKVIDN